MSTTTKRITAPRAAGSADQRLARLLDGPFLARIVPRLPPETLHQLIQHRGLEACGEMVTCATPAQLTSLLDLDLWRHTRPGRDEQFDADRFGEWLDVLAEIGESAAARTVAALDPHLVVVGLSNYVRVFDPGTFEPTEQTDDEPIDRHDRMNSETSALMECEVGGYLVRGRRTDAWDAIVALLITLEVEHQDCFTAVMQGCRELSDSAPETDGLDDLLATPEQQLHDVAIERDQRRSRQGYTTPADARAFLQMARQPRHHARTATNPIASAYFRAADEEADVTTDGRSSEGDAYADRTNVPAGADVDDSTSIDAVIELLAEAGVIPDRPRALLSAGDEDPRAAKTPLLRRLMQVVLHDVEAAHVARTREFGFLVNTLIAGGTVQFRPFTAQEAADAAAATCNLGLECWPDRWPGASSRRASSGRAPGTDTVPMPDTFLVDHDLVTAFEVGWAVLYQDVSRYVTEQLLSLLADLRCADPDTRREVRTLRRALEQQREAGTPWLARHAADVLATLDTTAWVSVCGLLDECPILPATLTAVLERRTRSVSQTAFEFISTTAQIGDVRLFMRMLPDLLAG